MIEWMPVILKSVLGSLASEGTKRVFEALRTTPRLAGGHLDEMSLNDIDDVPDDAESLRFLTRQRMRHREDLARSKWDWLILTAYHHPRLGRTDDLPDDWDPRAIGDQYTVADFAGRELYHEENLGENAPSGVRVMLIHNRIQIAVKLHHSIALLDEAISTKAKAIGLRPPPWPRLAVEPAWASFLAEVSGREFPDLANCNSYCGFKDLWSVSDTPGRGIRRKVQAGGKANLFAYASVMEIATRVTRAHYRQLHKDALGGGRETPHQWALRKVASAVLKDLWRAHADHWRESEIRDA